jgi:hypothetical protein
MMPSLTLEALGIHPERDSYYCIKLESAAAIFGDPWTLDQTVIGNVKQTIRNGDCSSNNRPLGTGKASR